MVWAAAEAGAAAHTAASAKAAIGTARPRPSMECVVLAFFSQRRAGLRPYSSRYPIRPRFYSKAMAKCAIRRRYRNSAGSKIANDCKENVDDGARRNARA